ncbi:MAG: indole-3-glycerol phosphate synthase TrpC [Vicinamibacteria bacterium]|nr:indole-3-glycerol phosphate synthase TrpC [Vicinamibacteria bacterium]
MTGETVLTRIVARAHEQVARRRAALSIDQMLAQPRTRTTRRPFSAVLARGDGPAVIAEFKRRSPSRGAIREDLSVVHAAHAYEKAGAAALSVLTEEQDFGGSLADLQQARQATRLPVLRKDFIVDPYQIWESWHVEADAVLLIATAVSSADLRELLRVADKAQIDALVEVHDERELDCALSAGACIVGVNNRDLRSLDVDLGTALRLSPRIPDDVVAVSESGIRGREDALRLYEAGYDALLIGEHLMRAPDPGEALRALTGKDGDSRG